MSYKRPIYQLTIDGQEVTLGDRLISLSLEDNSGMTADMLTLTLDDHDGVLILPQKGVKLSCAFGFVGELMKKGDYVVDEVSHSGPPDVLTIRASSADFCTTLTEGRETHYDRTTLGEMLKTIAMRHKLIASVHQDLAGIPIEHQDQTNESDANFVTRLAEQYGAMATIKSRHLLFTKRGFCKTIDDTDLPILFINREDTKGHSYQENERSARVTGVIAYYHDPKKGKRVAVHSKRKPKEKTADDAKTTHQKKQEQRSSVSVGDGGYQKHLKGTFANEAEAKAAAEAELKKAKRQAKTLSLTLSFGRADAIAEQPALVSGFKADFDAVSWYVKKITHTLNSSGYVSKLSLEDNPADEEEQ